MATTPPVVDSQTSSALDAIIERLVTRYQPEKIILFGSYAYGQPDPDSDIDLLIIKDTPERLPDRLVTVRRLTSDARRHIAFDPLVLTPQEVESRLRAGDQFIADIMEKGVILYAA